MRAVLQQQWKLFIDRYRFLYDRSKLFLVSIPDLTLQGVLYLGFIFFILMYSINQHDAVMFQVAIICYLIFGGAFIFSYINLSGITSKRQTPKFVFAKELFSIKVVIENHKKNIETFWLTLEDDFYKKEHHSLLSCLSIEPQSTLEKEFTTVIHRRGVYRQFSYRLISTFPFGIFIKEKIQNEEAELTVFPSPMDELELNTLLGVQQGSQGSLQIFNSDYHGELRGMRQFQPGDPIKSIHWSASMRANQILVRELEPTSTNKTLVIAHSVNMNSKRTQSRKAFEKMLQFLSGYFIYKTKSSSECFYSLSFDQYQVHQVNGENESLYMMLSKLADAKEYKESDASLLVNCIRENHEFTNIIVIGNFKKDTWAPYVYQANGNVICVDSTVVEGRHSNV